MQTWRYAAGYYQHRCLTNQRSFKHILWQINICWIRLLLDNSWKYCQQDILLMIVSPRNMVDSVHISIYTYIYIYTYSIYIFVEMSQIQLSIHLTRFKADSAKHRLPLLWSRPWRADRSWRPSRGGARAFHGQICTHHLEDLIWVCVKTYYYQC